LAPFGSTRQQPGRDPAGGLQKLFFFLRCEIIGCQLADAQRAAEALVVQHRHGQRALHLGLFRARLRHAGGVGLQIAHFHGLPPFRRRARDAFAHGNRLNDRHQCLRDALVRHQLEMFVRRVEPVQGSGRAAEFSDRLRKEIVPGKG